MAGIGQGISAVTGLGYRVATFFHNAFLLLWFSEAGRWSVPDCIPTPERSSLYTSHIKHFQKFKAMTKSFKHHELTRTALRLGRVHRSKRINRFQRYDKISHALQSYPHRFGAWRPIALATKITAQTGDQTDDLAQAGRLLRRRATFDHDIGCLPLLTIEDHLAIDIRACTPQHQGEQYPPSDDHVQRQTRQQACISNTTDNSSSVTPRCKVLRYRFPVIANLFKLIHEDYRSHAPAWECSLRRSSVDFRLRN